MRMQVFPALAEGSVVALHRGLRRGRVMDAEPGGYVLAPSGSRWMDAVYYVERLGEEAQDVLVAEERWYARGELRTP